MKVFDAHTHIYPEKIAARAGVSLGKFYNFVVEGEGTYEHLEKVGLPFGVEGFLILGVATNPSQVLTVNDYIADTVKLSKSRGFKSFGFMGIHQDFGDFASELDRCVERGLCGVKIHPDIQGVDIDDKRLFELYSLIEGKLPICLHMGDDRPQYRYSEPQKLARVLKEFPRLTVIASHLGAYKAWDSAIDCYAGNENVWFDTSSALWAMSTEYAKKIISHIGSERLMFGTDYPVKTTEEELDRVMKLGFSDSELENVIYGNAARFFDFK